MCIPEHAPKKQKKNETTNYHDAADAKAAEDVKAAADTMAATDAKAAEDAKVAAEAMPLKRQRLL